MSNIIGVASYEAAGSYPVAVTYRFYTGVGTAGVQHLIFVDKDSDIQASVFSAANANPIAVSLVDNTGQRTSVWSVTGILQVPSLFVGQMGSWQVGVTQATSPWIVQIASAVPLATVGSFFAVQQGSWNVQVTQATSPWIVQQASSGIAQAVTGTVAVTQVTSPWIVQVASTVGNGVTSVFAIQQGSWNVAVTQATSPWIVQQGSTGFTTAVTGTVAVTQVTSPWIVQVASIMGAGISPTSVFAIQQGSWNIQATQANTPWLVQQTSTGVTVAVTGTIAVTQVTSPWIVQVASIMGAGISPTSVFAIQQGSWQTAVTQTTSPWIVQVASIMGAGISPTSVFAIQQGSWQVEARITQVTSPLIVQVASIMGAGLSPTSVFAIQQGSWNVEVTQSTSPWIVQVASTVGGGVTSVYAIQQGSWNVQVTQATSPWVVLVGSGGFTQVVTGTLAVTQVTSPWITTIPSLGVFQSGVWSANVQGGIAHDSPYQGNPVHIGARAFDLIQTSLTLVDCGDAVSLIADRMGRLRVFIDSNTALSIQPSSVAAIQQGSWQTAVTQTSSPWIVQQASTGVSIAVTQTTSPWIVQVASTVGGGVTSVFAIQQGSWNVAVAQTTNPWIVQQSSTGFTTAITGTIAVTQVTSPWVVLIGSTGASVGVTSVFAIQQGSWNVAVTQATSPWIVQQGSTGFTTVITGTIAVTQVTSPWVTTVPSLSVFQSGTWSANVQGGIAHDSPYQGNPVHVGARAFDLIQTSLTLVDCGDTVSLIADRMGRLRVFIDSSTALSVLPPSVSAVQQGSWNVAVTQATSPWVVLVGSNGFTQAVTGTLAVTQSTSPWIVQVASTVAAGITSVFAIQQGSWNIQVTQASTPWLVQQTSTGVTLAVTGTLAVTQVTSPWVVLVGSTGASIGVTSVFAIQQGSWNVAVTQATSPWIVQVASASPLSAVGSFQAVQQGSWNVAVTQATSPWVVLIGSEGFTQAVTGTMAVTQVSSPWVTTIPSLSVYQSGTWSANVQGGIAHDAVYQGNPIILGAKAFDLIQTSLTLVDCGDAVSLIADRMGRLRVFIDSSATLAIQPSSVAAVQQGSWSVAVTQTSSPWIVQQASTGVAIAVTQTTSPWVVLVGSTGASIGVTSVFAIQQGSWAVLATQQNTPWLVQQTSTGFTTAVTGTLAVTQTTSPWMVSISSGGQSIGTVTIGGTVNTELVAHTADDALVLASEPVVLAAQYVYDRTNAQWERATGYDLDTGGGLDAVPGVSLRKAASGGSVALGTSTDPLVTVGSFFAVQQGSWNIQVTQVSSPWVVLVGSTGASIGVTSTFAIQQGSWQVNVSQVNSPWIVYDHAPIFTQAKIAWEVTSAFPYPYDGSGLCRSSGTGQICLSTTAHSTDIAGLAVMIVSSGATMGQVRGITGWAFQQSYEATVSPAWTTAGPSSGVKYTLLIDCRGAKAVQFRTEINSAAGRVYGAIGLYSAVQTGNIGSVVLYPQNVPVPSFDGLSTIDGIPSSFGITVPSFWPAENVGRDCLGYVGAKMFVTSYTAKYSMWGAAC